MQSLGLHGIVEIECLDPRCRIAEDKLALEKFGRFF
jgi:hypothetical protein